MSTSSKAVVLMTRRRIRVSMMLLDTKMMEQVTIETQKRARGEAPLKWTRTMMLTMQLMTNKLRTSLITKAFTSTIITRSISMIQQVPIFDTMTSISDYLSQRWNVTGWIKNLILATRVKMTKTMITRATTTGRRWLHPAKTRIRGVPWRTPIDRVQNKGWTTKQHWVKRGTVSTDKQFWLKIIRLSAPQDKILINTVTIP